MNIIYLLSSSDTLAAEEDIWTFLLILKMRLAGKKKDIKWRNSRYLLGEQRRYYITVIRGGGEKTGIKIEVIQRGERPQKQETRTETTRGRAKRLEANRRDASGNDAP